MTLPAGEARKTPYSRINLMPSAQVFVALMILAISPFSLGGSAFAEPSNPKLANNKCLRCHAKENFSREAANGQERDLHLAEDTFKQSVHGGQDCVNCHQDIIKIKHRKGIDRKVGCVSCHQGLWKQAQADGTTQDNARLGVVVKQIESYMGSIHARPSIADQSRTNATCYHCHDAHSIMPIDSHVGAEGRLKIPGVCGQCHGEILALYQTSVHGMEIGDGNANAAVCTDCHTTHKIEKPHNGSSRVAITKNCGSCHEENLKTYTETYHGKVTLLVGVRQTYGVRGVVNPRRIRRKAATRKTDTL
jgi:hypothetical protein